MRLNYDQATDSLYIHLKDIPAVDSDEVVEGVVLDYAADGALVGIDVQHARSKVDIQHLAISHLPLMQQELNVHTSTNNTMEVLNAARSSMVASAQIGSAYSAQQPTQNFVFPAYYEIMGNTAKAKTGALSNRAGSQR